MKLNPDCIRDILMTVEETVDFPHPMYFGEEHKYPRLSSYSHEEVLYHVRQCQFSGLLTRVDWFADLSTVLVQDLSPSGHEFLANIRAESNWAKTKAIAEKAGSASLQVLTSIASEIVLKMISRFT